MHLINFKRQPLSNCMLSYAHYSLEELFLLIQREDATAFDQLYQRTWEHLYTAAYSRLKNEILAREVIQDVYVDLWNKRALKNIQHVEAYLYQAVRFKVIDQFRKRKAKFEVVEDFVNTLEAIELADTDCLQKERERILQSWIDTLPQKRREIFLLRYNEGKTTSEIGKLLNISTKTVQNQLLNVTFALKQVIKKMIYILLFFFY